MNVPSTISSEAMNLHEGQNTRMEDGGRKEERRTGDGDRGGSDRRGGNIGKGKGIPLAHLILFKY